MKRTATDSQYIAAVARMIRSTGPRMAQADINDLVPLAQLVTLAEQTLREAVRAQRETFGYSWADIGRVLGISRQAAQQRFGEHRPLP